MASDEKEVEAVAAALWGLPSDLPRDVLTSARVAIAALDAHRAKVSSIDEYEAVYGDLGGSVSYIKVMNVIRVYLQHKAARRCEITGNEYGTDTWMKGHSCGCGECQTYLREQPAPPAPASEPAPACTCGKSVEYCPIHKEAGSGLSEPAACLTCGGLRVVKIDQFMGHWHYEVCPTCEGHGTGRREEGK